jgi:hypothetical protein
MGVRVKFDMLPEFVRPKLDDLDVTTITLSDLLPTSNLGKSSGIVRSSQNSQPSAQQNSSKGYHWKSWELSLSLSNMESAAKAVETFLKQLDKLTKVITQLLKVMRLLSGNVKSIAMFLKFAIKIIAKELKNFLDSFASSGIYMSVIAPSFDTKSPKYTIPVFGGFREFITRVNATCSNSPDPDAPRFNSPKDKVGGVIIGMIGGVNDKEFLSNLINNFRILSEFFGFQNPMPTPPKNFRVVAGFYSNPNRSGDKSVGVRLSWERQDTPVSSYIIYRSTSPKGILKNAKQDGADVIVRVLGEPFIEVPIVAAKLFYRYTDFDVDPGTRYYYKVYSVVGSNFFEANPTLEDIKSPIATPLIPAVPREVIPLSELAKYTTLGINGELLMPFNFEGDWQSFTVRTMLGKTLDGIFGQIDALADKLIGQVDTGSSATTAYIDFYAKKVSDLLDTITKFRAIIERLMAFNLRGSFMVLNLDVQEGGMANFVQRFNQASSIDNTQNGLKKPGDSPLAVSQNNGIAKYTEQGIMFGIIILYGYPEITTERLLEVVPLDQVKDLEKRIKNTETAVHTLLKLLGLE